MCLRQAGSTALSFTLYKCEIVQHTQSYNPAMLMKSSEGILGNTMLREDIHFHPAQISKSVLVQSFVCDSAAFSSWKKKKNHILLYEDCIFQIKGAVAEMLITLKKP